MMKCNSGLVARQIAAEQGVSFAASVFGGGWYVGTPEELTRIGCVSIATGVGHTCAGLTSRHRKCHTCGEKIVRKAA